MSAIAQEVEKVLAALQDRPSLPPLSPQRLWSYAVDRDIAAFRDGADREFRETAEAHALTAALHLGNDSLDRAHELVQAHEGHPTCDWVHAIVHRREGDYANSKYWVRRAGAHSAYHGLQARASRLLGESGKQPQASSRLATALEKIRTQGEWNAYLFVDAVSMQESGDGDAESRELLERLQHLEWQCLMRYLNGLLRLDGRQEEQRHESGG
jgi:hypothetical protein